MGSYLYLPNALPVDGPGFSLASGASPLFLAWRSKSSARGAAPAGAASS